MREADEEGLGSVGTISDLSFSRYCIVHRCEGIWLRERAAADKLVAG
jgi:hypothetical protein